MKHLRSPLILILFIAWLGAVMVAPVLGLNPTWIVLTGIAVASALLLLRTEDGIHDFKRLSLVSAWFWSHITFVVIPSLFVYQFETGNHPERFMLSVVSSLVLVPVGVLIGHRICGARESSVRAYYLKPVEGRRADAYSFGTICLVASGVGLALYHATQLASVPLLYMIQNPGEAAKASLLRDQAVKLLQSNMAYVYDVLAKVVFPILVMITGLRWLYLRTVWNRTVFFGTFILAVFYCGMTLEKSPVGLAVLCLVLAIYMRRKGEFKKEIWLVPIGIFGFPIVVFLYEFANSAFITGRDLLSAVPVRLFYGGAQVLFYYFDLVPETIPYQNGATIGKLAMLMGMPQSNIANYAGLRIDPTLPKSVTANAPFLGTLYADWGLTGVILGCVITGVIIALLQNYLISRPKTLRNMCIYGFVMLKITLLALAALPYVLGSGGVLIVMIPLFIEDLIGARRRRANGRRRSFPRNIVGSEARF
jgi:oligosaccharide repeat unit polymerase